jgi:hypothetical protein
MDIDVFYIWGRRRRKEIRDSRLFIGLFTDG